MKGIFQVRPALPRYQATWDTSVVLNYLKELPPVRELTLQQLTYKLVMLCALVTGQRAQSLHLINLLTYRKENNTYIFYIDQLVKQSGPTRAQPTLVIPQFPSDCQLCAASTMDEYIKRTAPIRGEEKQLFISTIRPYHKVSKASISRWIKAVMKAAGIDTNVFKPHSTRAAATSKVKNCDVPKASILKATSWKNDCVFHRFYNKNIIPQNDNTEFGKAILSSC